MTTGNVLLATGGGAAMTASGQVIDVVMGAATAGQGVRIATSGVYIGTTGILDINATGATSGVIASVDGTGLVGGTAIEVLATAATLTTGAYFRANDGGVNVFAIGLNGHIQSRQTTKPTIAVTQQNGITAAAITAGSTDTVGVITTTGTNNNGGTTILTITFGKAYAIAPQVVIAGANAAGSLIWPYISTTTTTTFVVTIPASASSGATPSWYYQVLEMGS